MTFTPINSYDPADLAFLLNRLGNELSDDITEAGQAPSWTDLTGKPSSFPPASHRHDWSAIDGKPSSFPPASHRHDWSAIDDKPSSFPPAAHQHQINEVQGLVDRLAILERTTGWRNVASLLPEGLALSANLGEARLKREGDQVKFSFKLGVNAVTTTVFTLMAGFRPVRLQYLPAMYVGPGTAAGASILELSNRLGYTIGSSIVTPSAGALVANSTVVWVGEYETADPWPTTLPGTPA